MIAIRERVQWDAAEDWLTETFSDLHRIAAEHDLEARGADGALYSEEFFEVHEGDVIAFVPAAGLPGRVERALPIELPGRNYAITVHEGPFSEIDRAYAALGTFVTERSISDGGPIRENYIVTAADTANPDDLVTEVCWPIRPRA